MSGILTVVAAGGATVRATGTYTAIGLAQVSAILNQASMAGSSNVVVYDPSTGIPTPPSGSTYVLIVPNDITIPLSLTVPDTYSAVILGEGTNATVNALNPNIQILSGGILNFAGSATLVDGSGGSGTITDTAINAVIDIGGGSYSVDASSGHETVDYDNGLATITAVNDSLVLGDGTMDAAYFLEFPAASSVTGTKVHSNGRNAVTLNSNGNLILDNSGTGSNTISGVYGTSTVFAGANDLYDARNNPAAVKFIADSIAGTTQTVFGGTANDTVFGAAANVLYEQGSGAASYFVAGSGDSTVIANGSGAVFGGTSTSGTLFNTGTGNDYFVGGGGSDTIEAGVNPSASVFGGNNEHIFLDNTALAYVMPLGNQDTIDASGTEGGTNFFSYGTGNVTLIGNATAPTPDLFIVYSVNATAPHTITIENWHTGDGLFLQNYGPADVATFDQAFAEGGSTVTLSDGTTVQFEGAHPQHSGGNAAY
jgi:hypothetical protein